MPSISTVVHLSMLCHQPKQISPLADASFPWFERRFFSILILLKGKQDRLELCHSELASVSVTIQIRSFPLLLVAIWMCSFLNPHVSKSKTWLVPKPVSNFSRTKYNIQTPLNADTLLLRTKESPYIFSYINIIQTAYADTPFIRTLSKAPTMSVWTWLIRTYQQLTCTYINTNQVLNSSHQWNGSYWQEG